MRHKIVWPNVLTALGLTCGLFIIFTLSMSQVDINRYNQLVSCFVVMTVAAILDTLDGAVARAMNIESDFGGFFDSMSDAITFGVAPSVIILQSFSCESMTLQSILLVAAAMAYSITGVLRLVRFSTATDTHPAHKYVFTGLPIPAAAFSATSFVLFGLSLLQEKKAFFTSESFVWATIGMLFFISYMMISRWRFPSIKVVNIVTKSSQILAPMTCLAAIFSFLVVCRGIVEAMCISSWSYIIISWGIALFYLATKRRTLAINDMCDSDMCSQKNREKE